MASEDDVPDDVITTVVGHKSTATWLTRVVAIEGDAPDDVIATVVVIISHKVYRYVADTSGGKGG